MRILYLIIMSFCGYTLFYSCSQDDVLPTIQKDDADALSFQIGIPAARGFLASSDLATLGTKISVYGYLDEMPLSYGTEAALSGKNLEYKNINDVNRWIIVDDSGNPLTYYWLGLGTYKFYGWLKHDAAGSLSTPNDWTYNSSTKKLNIQTTTVDKDYNQYDFLYSEVDQRIMDASNFATLKRQPVSLSMKHLFTAFGIGIRNTSEDAITVKKVALYAIHETGSAEIDYSGETAATTYTTSTSRAANVPFISSDTQFTLISSPTTGGTVEYNIFNPAEDAKHYYMVWPQSAEVLSPTNADPNPSDDREYLATDSIFYIKYQVGENTFEKRLKFPANAWEAGKRNYLEVQVADKLVSLTATVKDWDYTSSVVDFQDNILVEETDRLTYDEEKSIVDKANKKVYIKNGQPAEASFTIDAPTGGQWRVSLEGDVTAFEIVDDTDPTDDGFGPIDGQQHKIKIVPLISNPDRDYVVRLKFVVVTADSKILPADNMIQGTDNNHNINYYNIILQSVN